MVRKKYIILYSTSNILIIYIFFRIVFVYNLKEIRMNDFLVGLKFNKFNNTHSIIHLIINENNLQICKSITAEIWLPTEHNRITIISCFYRTNKKL